MAKIFVYDTVNRTLQIFNKGESETMPYITNNTMRVREFRGSSRSSVLWTTKQAMESWNKTRAAYGKPIPFRYAFKRIWEGGHGLMSQHYAGVSFDVGQALSSAQRREIHRVARNLGVWGYVEPLSMTPTWVHFDRRYGKPACSTGYTTLREGCIGAYVLVLQDALNTLGYSTAGLDGRFGRATRIAVNNFQGDNNLRRDGIAGCSTWEKLTSKVTGKGKTSTTVDP